MRPWWRLQRCLIMLRNCPDHRPWRPLTCQSKMRGCDTGALLSYIRPLRQDKRCSPRAWWIRYYSCTCNFPDRPRPRSFRWVTNCRTRQMRIWLKHTVSNLQPWPWVRVTIVSPSLARALNFLFEILQTARFKCLPFAWEYYSVSCSNFKSSQ